MQTIANCTNIIFLLKVPYETKYEVHVPKPYTVVKKIPIEVKVPVSFFFVYSLINVE